MRKEVFQTQGGEHRAKERHKEAALKRYDDNSKQIEQSNNRQPGMQLNANKGHQGQANAAKQKRRD
jgi:hypothetical protein